LTFPQRTNDRSLDMRALLYIPVAALLVCISGYAGCAALGWQPHPREMLIAATTCLAGGLLAIVPLLVHRRFAAAPTAAGAAQAALIGTMVHLFVCIGVAAVVLLTKMPVGSAFTYWLLAFYWTTLLALAAALIVDIRAVAAARPGETQQN
jgi:hypothetical protein